MVTGPDRAGRYTEAQQRAIVTRGKHLCVEAGAGSGKTLVLVDRIMGLLQGGVPLQRIVAITFTDKAAIEMRERLRRACHASAPMDDPAAMSRWRQLEREMDSARISTIHRFCASVLRENALLRGLDPDFTVLTEAESELLRGEVVRAAVERLLEEGRAGEGGNGVAGGLAWPAAEEYGVRGLRDAIESLLEKRGWTERLFGEAVGVDELAIFWKRMAEEEYGAHARELLRKRPVAWWVGALEGFEGRCEKETDGRERLRRAMLSELRAIDETMRPEEIGSRLAALAAMNVGNTRGANWRSKEDWENLKGVQDELKEFVQELAPLEADAEVERRAAELTLAVLGTYRRVRELYESAKRERAAMDFDDLIAEALRLLETNAEARRRVAAGIDHLLIDEFQDTDSTQWAIARLLRRAAGEAGAEVFVVGDPKQSIYGFRGAEVEVFRDASKASDETIPLDINFRSVPNLLNFINEFFERADLFDAETAPFAELKAQRGGVEGPRVEFLAPMKDPEASADDYRRKEAELIADRLAWMCTGGVEVVDPATGLSRAANYGDAAVLFRALSSLGIYEEALRDRGVPFEVVGGKGFYERQEISDLRNLLTAVWDPWDEMALTGFLRSPLAGLSDESLYHLAKGGGLARGFYSGAALPDGEQERRRVAARALLEELEARRALPLGALVRYALDRTQYEAVLLSQFHGVQKAMNVRKVAELAETFSSARGPGLGAFVRYLSGLSSREVQEGDAPLHVGRAGPVTLMTVHKAKGLEFPIVVVADTARGLQGSRTAEYLLGHRRLGIAAKVMNGSGEWATPAAWEWIKRARKRDEAGEFARVLYVALTRARDWLLIGGAPVQQTRGESWFEHFERVFRVSDRADGETLSGRGWSAVVRRAVTGVAEEATYVSTTEEAPDEVLERQAGPLPPESRGMRSLAISEALDALTGPEDYEGAAVGRADGRLRGELVHRLFEQWGFDESPGSVIERILRAPGVSPEDEEELRQYLMESAERLRRSELWQVLREGAPVRKELPFVLRSDGGYLRGAIDARLADGTLIDYKTGKADARRRERYARQLQLYAGAYRRLEGPLPPRAYLYYVDSGELEEVDVGPSSVEAVFSALTAHLRRNDGPVDGIG